MICVWWYPADLPRAALASISHEGSSIPDVTQSGPLVDTDQHSLLPQYMTHIPSWSGLRVELQIQLCHSLNISLPSIPQSDACLVEGGFGNM